MLVEEIIENEIKIIVFLSFKLAEDNRKCGTVPQHNVDSGPRSQLRFRSLSLIKGRLSAGSSPGAAAGSSRTQLDGLA